MNVATIINEGTVINEGILSAFRAKTNLLLTTLVTAHKNEAVVV